MDFIRQPKQSIDVHANQTLDIIRHTADRYTYLWISCAILTAIPFLVDVLSNRPLELNTFAIVQWMTFLITLALFILGDVAIIRSAVFATLFYKISPLPFATDIILFVLQLASFLGIAIFATNDYVGIFFAGVLLPMINITLLSRCRMRFSRFKSANKLCRKDLIPGAIGKKLLHSEGLIDIADRCALRWIVVNIIYTATLFSVVILYAMNFGRLQITLKESVVIMAACRAISDLAIAKDLYIKAGLGVYRKMTSA